MANVGKADIIETVSKETGLLKGDAERAVNETINAIADALAHGETVQILGFGTFEVKRRAARTAPNPQTGGTVEIPERNAPVFRAGKKLKDAVN